MQRAISAQQIYGGSQRLIIPTPDAILYDSDYKQLKRKNVYMPKQLIHVQGKHINILIMEVRSSALNCIDSRWFFWFKCFLSAMSENVR